MTIEKIKLAIKEVIAEITPNAVILYQKEYGSTDYNVVADFEEWEELKTWVDKAINIIKGVKQQPWQKEKTSQ